MNRDYLTGLYNMMYLREKYKTYVKKNKNAKIVAIDFAKLKYINDNFGHCTGDKCLKLFSSFISILFPDSILVRRSGDEFIIVTSFPDKVLEEKINEINLLIIQEAKFKNIPIVFDFNCGVKGCDENLDDCLKEADIVMYCAKQNKKRIMFFDESIILKHQRDSEFINMVQKIYNDHEYNFAYQTLTNGSEKKIKEIYARDSREQSIFDGKLYDLLTVNHIFRIIDFNNINYLLNNHRNIFNEIIMINVSYYSLLSKDYKFTGFLSDLISTNNINANNIILSINVSNMDSDVNELISVLDEVSKLGVLICLDNCNYNTLSIIMNLIRNTMIKYVKIDKAIWNIEKNNTFDELVLKTITNLFLELEVTPIFKRIEIKEEYEALKKFKGSLYSGRYFYKEEKLKKD